MQQIKQCTSVFTQQPSPRRAFKLKVALFSGPTD